MRFDQLERRKFVALLGGAAAWPLAARAQQPTMPVIGWLDSGSQPSATGSAAFRKGLSELGYIEGHNVIIEYRGAEQYEQLLASAREFVRRHVAVIFATETVNSARAAKAATTTIPIVFQNGGDPVRLGLVASFNRPGGNVTGLAVSVAQMVAKRLELLRELVPRAGNMGYLTNPTNLVSQSETAHMQTAAHSVGQPMMVLRASTVEEIDTAFATAVKEHLGALLVGGDGLLFNRRANQISALAAHYRIPATYPTRVYPDAGGLLSYGDNRYESWRLSGIYLARILKGDKPADLPVLQPTKFELVINLKTAKALGLDIPLAVLARADEVIE
jgi:putative tryptophan/tyrosine transport system substrate-binding protein